MGQSKRIEWIDLAKGICIVLVVFHHVMVRYDLELPLSDALSSFRMPLYFILSGLFFKLYEGFEGFVKRKVNKLLIPFAFFLVTTSLLPYWIINHGNSLVFFFFKSICITLLLSPVSYKDCVKGHVYVLHCVQLFVI